MKDLPNPLAAALWSIAIPGFGQLYNRRLLKAFVFIILEIIINVNSHLNLAIFYSWLFDIPKAQQVINYEWLMFYPCVYVFAIFDAYHDCCINLGRTCSRYIYIPFFFTCFAGTIMIVLSSGCIHFMMLERIGPVFTGCIIMLLGLGVGSWAVNRYLPHPK